jgi:hypothetical protein
LLERLISDRGRHTATNEYQSCKHVILAGVLQYSVPENEAVARSAKGITAKEELPDKDYQSIRLGEIAHNIFQASSRGYVRRSVADECPSDCHLYAIFSTHAANGIPRRLLQDIFPESLIEEWTPVTKVVGKKRKELVSYIEKAYNNGQVTINKSIVVRDLGLKDRYYLDRILKDLTIIESLKENDIVYTHNETKIDLSALDSGLKNDHPAINRLRLLPSLAL